MADKIGRVSQSPAKKIATAALYGTGGLSALGALLVGEGLWAKRVIGTSDARPPSPDGIYGADQGGELLSVLILGDSSIVGYGMEAVDDTPPAMIGVGLAHVLDRPVRITSRAVVGARTRDLNDQIDASGDQRIDVAIIVVGANDVTHAKPPRRAARELGATVRRLRGDGAKVVVATCPDLGTVRPLPQPLRSLAQVWSRRLAERQTIAAVWAGARTVSLADLLGDLFTEQYERMFGDDRFHPSRDGYANLAGVLVASTVASVREIEPPRSTDTPRDMLPVSEAAHAAAQQAGTEVTKSGRWASLLKRRQDAVPNDPELAT